MDPILQFFLALSIVVLVAKASGLASTLIGQPAVLGELLAGIIIGPSVLNMLHWDVFGDPHLEETILHLSHVGVLFLMFVAGLEVDLRSLRETGRPAVLAGLLGVIAPVGLGYWAGLAFDYDPSTSLFMGLVLAATSVSISAQTLMELGVLKSRVGLTLLAAAVVDDVLVILLLSVFVALVLSGGGGASIVLLVIVQMVVYLVLSVVLGLRFVPRLTVWVERLPISEGVMAFAIVMMLLFSWSAEHLGGVAAITGAFIAGLAFAQTPLREGIERGMHTMAYSFFVPIFFVSIGLQTNVRELTAETVPFAVTLIVIAVVSKIAGCGLGGLMTGLPRLDSLRLGVGMMSRGEVGLIVAAVGINQGLIGQSVFASVVVMVLVTTVLTPVVLRMLYPQAESAAEATT